MLWFVFVVPTRADVPVDLTIAPAQSERGADQKGAADEEERRELAHFETAEISLREALKIAGQFRFGARIVDVSFDATGRIAVYRVESIRGDHIWKDMIDATTGRIMAAAAESAVADLETTDRRNLIAFRSVRLEIADAVRVAERNAPGSAISAGLLAENGKLNFVVVVVSGKKLRQVILQPPASERRQAGKWRSR